MRQHGKATFSDIQDGTGKIQVYLREDKLGEAGCKFFLDNFDIGDFIEVKGALFAGKKDQKLRTNFYSRPLLPFLKPKLYLLKSVQDHYSQDKIYF